MGKIIIIKGADFSENGMKETFLGKMPLVLLKGWGSTLNSKNSPHIINSDNVARASQEDFVNISSFVRPTNLKLKAKSGYKFAAYFGNTNVPNTPDANITTWTYINSDEILEVDISSCTYAVIMVASNDDSELTSTDWSTYIEELY
jgi:hypothetical protein